jgi:hypothetical protein
MRKEKLKLQNVEDRRWDIISNSGPLRLRGPTCTLQRALVHVRVTSLGYPGIDLYPSPRHPRSDPQERKVLSRQRDSTCPLYS